jgi:CBS domain containing-hemolysin-like protein
MSREAVVDYVRETGHSRFPFSPGGDLDEVTGVVFAKELLDALLRNPDAPIVWDTLQHEILTVPDTLSLPKLLQTFQESHRHLALVVDEYGTVQGIATLEDVLEEIVGDIRDESDTLADDIRERVDGSMIVRGSVDLRQLSSRLGVVWHPEEDVSSVGGLLTEKLERIPVPGDSIAWNGYELKVISADRHKTRWLSVRKVDDA